MTADNKTLNEYFFIVGSLSIFGTSLVMLTYAMFPRLRQYRHVELTFYIAFNDLCAAVAVVVGKAKNHSAACWFQSIGTSYSFLASVFWSAVVTYQIYIIINHGRILEDLSNYHKFCWLFPLLVVLLPLSTNNYGEASSSWCFLGDRPDSPPEAVFAWELVSFFIWLWLAIIFIIFVFSLIVFRLWDVDTMEVMAAYRPLYRLACIPIVLVFCWTLPSFLVFHGAITKSSYEGPGTQQIHMLAAILPPLQGFLTSMSFFIVNKSAREEWKNSFSCFRAVKTRAKSEFDPSRTASVRTSSFLTVSGSSSLHHSDSNISALHAADASIGYSNSSGNSISANVRPGDSAWLTRATGSKQSVRSLAAAIPHNSSLLPPQDRQSMLKSNLADRDSTYERGSDSYWTAPSTTGSDWQVRMSTVSLQVTGIRLNSTTSQKELQVELNGV